MIFTPDMFYTHHKTHELARKKAEKVFAQFVIWAKQPKSADKSKWVVIVGDELSSLELVKVVEVFNRNGWEQVEFKPYDTYSYELFISLPGRVQRDTLTRSMILSVLMGLKEEAVS